MIFKVKFVACGRILSYQISVDDYLTWSQIMAIKLILSKCRSNPFIMSTTILYLAVFTTHFCTFEDYYTLPAQFVFL